MRAFGASVVWMSVETFEKEWSITDVSREARTTEENISLATLPKSRKKFNVSHAPFFPNILTNVVIDNLHLFLRVSDVLMNHLIEELLRQDAIEKSKRFTTFDCSKHKHVYSFEKFVAGIGILNFNFYIGKTSKWRTPTGSEKLKLFPCICISELLPTVKA